jgi:hypothetical protein
VGAVKIILGLNSEAKDFEYRIPSKYYEFLDVYKKQMADALSFHQNFDYAIDLKNNTDPL